MQSHISDGPSDAMGCMEKRQREQNEQIEFDDWVRYEPGEPAVAERIRAKYPKADEQVDEDVHRYEERRHHAPAGEEEPPEGLDRVDSAHLTTAPRSETRPATRQPTLDSHPTRVGRVAPLGPRGGAPSRLL
jgi:hypothetical protein